MSKSKINKSPGAYKSIGETSELLDIPQHVLRFWEVKFSPYLKPIKVNNRRYFDPENISVIRLIKEMLYEKGFTIKGVINHFQGQKLDKTLKDNKHIQADSLHIIRLNLINSYEKLRNIIL